MEFNYDADKKPIVMVRIEDFMCMSHGALYASSDIEYIKQFPHIAHQIVEAAERINNTREFIITKLANETRKKV